MARKLAARAPKGSVWISHEGLTLSLYKACLAASIERSSVYKYIIDNKCSAQEAFNTILLRKLARQTEQNPNKRAVKPYKPWTVDDLSLKTRIRMPLLQTKTPRVYKTTQK